MTPLEAAKERIPIPELAHFRGWGWEPGRSCRVPYRADRNPSGSVFFDGKLFRDFASGETLDAPALLVRVEQISNEDACRLLIGLAGTAGDHSLSTKPAPAWITSPRPKCKPDLGSLQLSRLTDERLHQLAELRALRIEALRIARARGLVHFAWWHGCRCWALTDSSRWLCQIRRLDGADFRRSDGFTYKSHTAFGSWQSWPIGIEETSTCAAIALVEGGPDFLSAFHFISLAGSGRSVAPVAMLGGNRIADVALNHFKGRRVRIFAHVDQAGIEAAARWEEQLQQIGADVHTYNLAGLTRADGRPVSDLNDVARMSPTDFAANQELTSLMEF